MQTTKQTIKKGSDSGKIHRFNKTQNKMTKHKIETGGKQLVAVVK